MVQLILVTIKEGHASPFRFLIWNPGRNLGRVTGIGPESSSAMQNIFMFKIPCLLHHARARLI
jgi:hypothetical protein